MFNRYVLLNFLYRWLPIVCGCHCRDDRSFHTRGIRHPVCARCEGVLLGVMAGLITVGFRHPPLWVLGLFVVPMVVDGTVQKVTAYESTNGRRFLTGILFGYALTGLIMVSLLAAFRFGYRIGAGLR